MGKINTLETATIFQRELDNLAVQEAVTGWMDFNAGQVKYNGGSEVKIPIMNIEGLGDYDRENGYSNGAVSLRYQTKTLTQDRGRKFSLDAMDVDETNFVATATRVMGEFQRTKVTPEIDAYRISKIASEVLTKNEPGMVKQGYTPAKGIYKEIKTARTAIKKKGYYGQIVCHISPDALLELECELSDKLRAIDGFAGGGLDSRIFELDKSVILIETDPERMQTVIALNDGKSEEQKAGGFKAGESSKEINFIAIPRPNAIAVTKLDVMRIFDPLTNQDANAWRMDYRRFHDAWVMDNKVKQIYLNTK